MSRGKQKKLAVLNDFTGFGRCALTVQLPVISALKVQCCPVPTAILSNHTAYPDYYMEDFTERIPVFTEKWKKLGLEFDGILTGFLGSLEQFDAVEAFLQTFSGCGKVIVDPVMGDNGKCYATYTEEMCSRMRDLAAKADLITPNLTECCILAERPYRTDLTLDDVEEMAELLMERGTKQVVVTGVVQGDEILSLTMGREKRPAWVREHLEGAVRCGTGDIFTAVLAASMLQGISLEQACAGAARFVSSCLQASDRLEIPLEDGLAFEEVLPELFHAVF